MDRASQVLTQGAASDVSRTWVALSEENGVPLTTLYYRAHGRPSKKEKTQRQQYLIKEEKNALVSFLLLMSDFGQPVQIKYIPSLIFSIARQRFVIAMDNLIKPSNKNWTRAFEKHNPKLEMRRVKSID